MSKKPNIIFIFPDQHRADVMGCAGDPIVKTPNIDALAAEGVRFGRCHTNSPLCVPARTSIITGQYVSEHGIWSNNFAASEKGPSHVRQIRDAGYHTAMVGKAHIYPHGKGHTNDYKHVMEDWGYEDIHEITGPLATGRMDSPYTDYLKELGLLEIHRKYVSDHGRVIREETPWYYPPCPLPTEAHLDVYVGREAVRWLRNYDENKPFYYQICFPAPHDPYDAPGEYREQYRLEDIPLGMKEVPQAPLSPLVERFLNIYQNRTRLQEWTDRQRRYFKQGYYGKVTMIDHWVGEIVKVLRERNMLENTWIIYTSDHGDNLGERCLLQKMVFFDQAQLIPCIIRPPSGMNGRVSDVLSDQLDIVATMLDIAKAEPPVKPHGMSLLTQVTADAVAAVPERKDKAVISEVFGFTTVITDDYMMGIEAQSLQPVELYDLIKDPRQTKNIVNEPSMERVKKELFDKYIQPVVAVRNNEFLTRYIEQDRLPRDWK